MKMREKSTDLEAVPRGKLWLSRLGVLAAAALLVLTCTTCCPKLTSAVRRIVAGAADSPAVQAFSAFADALREGGGVREAFAGSVEILTDAAD